MKLILKILFFIPILFISSCEELEDAIPIDTDQFFGVWYSNQNIENYTNFTVNSNQTVIPMELYGSGSRAFEGGIVVSGSGINDTVNYNYALSDGDGLLLTNLSLSELGPLMDYGYYYEFPDELIMLGISEDSDSLTVLQGGNVYAGSANFTWHIDFEDSLALENLAQNSDLTLLSFNGSSVLANINNPSETISLSGSIGVASSNLEANTPVDYFEFLFGMSMSDVMSSIGEMGDDMTEELGITLTINEDSTYTIILTTTYTFVESEESYWNDTTYTVLTTCSGVWTVSNNKIHIDGSNKVCWDDESSGTAEVNISYTNIEIGFESNGNLELHMWDDSFCNVSDLMGEFDGYTWVPPAEEDCRTEVENNLNLEPNSLSSFASGAYFELSNTQNQNVFFNHKYFQSYLNRNMSKIRSSFLQKTQAGILENIK